MTPDNISTEENSSESELVNDEHQLIASPGAEPIIIKSSDDESMRMLKIARSTAKSIHHDLAALGSQLEHQVLFNEIPYEHAFFQLLNAIEEIKYVWGLDERGRK